MTQAYPSPRRTLDACALSRAPFGQMLLVGWDGEHKMPFRSQCFASSHTHDAPKATAWTADGAVRCRNGIVFPRAQRATRSVQTQSPEGS